MWSSCFSLRSIHLCCTFRENFYHLPFFPGRQCTLCFLYNADFQHIIQYNRCIMAEIKSTMDLVMERMAKMTANAKPVNQDEDNEKAGMRLAAEYLNQQLPDLVAELTKQPKESQQVVFKGAVQTLLRNVVLPRDEMLQERSDASLSGVIAIADSFGASAVSQVCSELKQILEQYNQHKSQVVEQLEGALMSQLEQQYGAQGADTSKLRASMHPKYSEEMAKMEQDLNNQYIQAMDQRKEMILEQMGLS